MRLKKKTKNWPQGRQDVQTEEREEGKTFPFSHEIQKGGTSLEPRE